MIRMRPDGARALADRWFATRSTERAQALPPIWDDPAPEQPTERTFA